MKTATELTKSEIQNRIKALEAEPRALVGSDAGTHGKPGLHRLYEEITGERYATYSFSGANAGRCSEQSAYDDTDGRVIIFPNETNRIRGLQRELKQLQKQLREME